MISAHGLTKSFGPVSVLRGLDLDISAVGWTAITGPSGSGKSTLMAVLGTLTPRDGGSMDVLGMSVPLRPSARVSARVRAATAWLPQLPLVLPGRTCLDNALAGIRATRAVTAGDIDYATALFSRLGVAHLQRRDVSVLSGGELQRLALIRALVRRPLLALADEPTASLDAAATELVIGALVMASKLATLLAATLAWAGYTQAHLVHDFQQRKADQLAEGKYVAAASTDTGDATSGGGPLPGGIPGASRAALAWQLLVEFLACLVPAVPPAVAAVAAGSWGDRVAAAAGTAAVAAGAALVVAAAVPVAYLMTIRRGTELTALRGAE